MLCLHSPSLSCVQLCNAMGSSLPDSFVYGILQARVLEWVAISSSRRSSQPRDQTFVSCISCLGRWILLLLHHLENPVKGLYLDTLSSDYWTLKTKTESWKHQEQIDSSWQEIQIKIKCWLLIRYYETPQRSEGCRITYLKYWDKQNANQEFYVL